MIIVMGGLLAEIWLAHKKIMPESFELTGSSEKRAPICDVLSVLAPFAAFPAYFIAYKMFWFLHPNDDGWLSGVAFITLPVIGCFFGGLIMVIIALLRDEKWRALPLIGFVLNLLPFLVALVKQ